MTHVISYSNAKNVEHDEIAQGAQPVTHDIVMPSKQKNHA